MKAKKKELKQVWRPTIALLVITILVFTSCTMTGNVAKEDTLKIGAIIHLSNSDYADIGQAMLQGVQLHVDKTNSERGVNGKQVELIVEDSQYNTRLATSAARKLINIDKVDAVLVSTHTEAKAVGQLFEEAEIPLLVLWDSNEELEQMGEYVFGTGVWTKSSGEKPADFAIDDLNAKTAFIVSHNTEWSSSVGVFFEDRFTETGREVLGSKLLGTHETDFRTVLVQAKEKEPDVIFVTLDRQVETFVKQAKELGVKAQIIGVETMTQSVIDNAQGAAEGIYFADFASSVETEVGKKVKDLFVQKQGHEPKLFGYVGFGHDAALLVTTAAEKAGSTQPQAIAKGLYSIEGLQGVFGELTMTVEGSTPRKQSIFVVEDGRQKFHKH